jgi:hypothetical protein
MTNTLISEEAEKSESSCPIVINNVGKKANIITPLIRPHNCSSANCSISEVGRNPSNRATKTLTTRNKASSVPISQIQNNNQPKYCRGCPQLPSSWYLLPEVTERFQVPVLSLTHSLAPQCLYCDILLRNV